MSWLFKYYLDEMMDDSQFSRNIYYGEHSLQPSGVKPSTEFSRASTSYQGNDASLTNYHHSKSKSYTATVR